MRPTWDSFWHGSPAASALLEPLNPSPVQRNFLCGLSPFDAPAIGLELSKRGLRRRPHMAALILSNRLQRWQSILAPFLDGDGGCSGGLSPRDLQGLLEPMVCLQAETWLEFTEAPRVCAGQSFLLFRRLADAMPQERVGAWLQGWHAGLAPVLRSRLPLPSGDWWADLAPLSLGSLDQVGVDLHPGREEWRLLFLVPSPQALLQQLNLAPPLQAALQGFPLALALGSRQRFRDRYALEVFPLYRLQHTITGHPGPIPTGPQQWPRWPAHPALLPARKLDALTQLGLYHPSLPCGSRRVALRGGLSHQKLVFEASALVDHKAYMGAMVSTPIATSWDHALAWLAQADQGWGGFALRPGVSDQWVPLACLTLLADWREHARLKAAYTHQQRALEFLLECPRPVGYNRHTPVDGDSSIWLRRCLLALDRPSSPELDRWLERIWRADEGVRTYPDPGSIAAFIQRPVAQLRGWCAPHDCVLANFASDPGLPHAAEALQLLRQRLDQGFFRSTWWPHDGLMLSLLPRGCLPRLLVRRVQAQTLTPAVRAAMPEEAAERLERFAHALFLLRHGTTPEQHLASEQLDRLITAPAAFQSLLVMQLPDPDVEDPADQANWRWAGDREGGLAPDPHGYLAAALVLSAQVRSR
ncbi:hypothetical protein SynRS9909_00266 [Synechococcus sp. RS9909]|uniref:hypothetical protein n=1 Tax=unclassified Synechococcus TaxID=2626047 RepID=UPI00006906D7|nr:MULTISPECIES: hypothetical protein [unclassified Synechococcus]EAQ70065.1 hypothetical protein RS9917_04500 [Synechococcus sp. RS9917]QNI78281.1 hypothetical protein SynRS9909_00266 [Synechococcus sp. RS9909]